MRSLLLVIIFMGVLTVKAETVKVLRVGDSITCLTAINPELYDKLTEAGIEVVFVGSQRPYPDREGLVTACEGFNGRRIEFLPLTRLLMETSPTTTIARWQMRFRLSRHWKRRNLMSCS